MTETAIIVENLNKSFVSQPQNIQALRNISFSLDAGKIHGLIGPDGAGKTTLMRLLAGLLQADSGTISVLGLDIKQSALAVQSKIGYMPQRFGLYEDLTVLENLNLYADLQHVPVRERHAVFSSLLDMTGLAPFTKRLAGNLSGGMKQKLGLACTLIRTPDCLLLDEPTVGVDPVSRRELWQIVDHQVASKGMTVLLSTAYLDEAESCDEVLLLHQGQLIQQAAPQHFSDALIGRVFQLHSKQLKPRLLQAQLKNSPNIKDSVPENDRIRVITHHPGLSTENLNSELTETLTITPASPRFEDAFIDLLKSGEQIIQKPTSIALEHEETHNQIIHVKSLTRRFGEFIAVNNVNFSVNRGEIFGLLGANGAGKSTTFRMICGLLPISDGHISIAGKNLRTAAASARGRIGYMAQKFSLYGHLSVQQNLNFFSRAYGLRGMRQQQRINWALDTFDLAHYRSSNAGELPLGFKQRLSFATALMHEPDILFLDEPTSGVDPLARREFWERTNELAENGVTVLVTTHFMEEANYCDRLVIMASGKILATGSPSELRRQAQSETLPNPSMEDAFIQLIQQQQVRL